MEKRDLYCLKDFLKLAGISRGTFYIMRKRGEGPKEIRLGSRVYITRHQVEEWMKEKEEQYEKQRGAA
jgi:predicted DNA-binding transcriptional regulator AlpA